MNPPVAPGLIIRHLGKSFAGHAVLDDIDLDVAKGGLVTVLGPSGTGKTTLLRLICGFERADTGYIELNGKPVVRGHAVHVPPEKRGIGYVAQEGALFPHLSVRDNILFGLSRRLRRRRNGGRAKRVSELLELVGLPAHYARRVPSALSGGEQQRVALARALAPDPAVVLLDEPFSALDAGLRSETRQAVAASLKRVHATAILVTHDQSEALSMGDQVAILQQGRLAQVASPADLYHHPANRTIARFVGHAVLVPGMALGGVVECCFGRLPLAPEVRELTGADQGEVEVLIRPEQFRLHTDSGEGGAASAPTARVEQLQFYGHDARVGLRLDSGQQFTATVPGFNLPAVGQSIRFRVSGSVFAYPSSRGC